VIGTPYKDGETDCRWATVEGLKSLLLFDAADSIESAAKIADAHSRWERVRDGSLPLPGDIVLCLPEKQSLHMGVVMPGGRVLTSTQGLGSHMTKMSRMLGVIGFYRFKK
jgi:hypothetical protein